MTSLLALHSNTSHFLGRTEMEITKETIYCKAVDSYQMCIWIISPLLEFLLAIVSISTQTYFLMFSLEIIAHIVYSTKKETPLRSSPVTPAFPHLHKSVTLRNEQFEGLNQKVKSA